MRVAFFGLPLAALLLARDGHEVVYAGICRDAAPGLRRARRTLGDVVSVRPDVTSAAVAERVRASAPDLVVSWFWTTRLPRAVLQTASRGALGVHPSLLPRHRGPDPYFWAIDAGDVETGVTAHVLDDEYDTGAVLARRSLRIDPAWNAWTLARKLDRPSLGLLREVVRAYAAGTPPAPVPQDEAAVTRAPAPSDDELEIRWSWPAARIARRVRAAAPWPGAYTAVGGRTVALVEAAVTDDFPRALAPGEAWVRADGVAVVRAADAALELRRGRDEEDERELGVAELANRVRAAAGGPEKA